MSRCWYALADEAGGVMAATVTGLLAEGRLDLDGAGDGRRSVPRREAGLEGLPEAMVEAARWWERHIAEVVYGLPPDAPPGKQPKPQYDPELVSLTAREKAKAGELVAAGHRVSASTLKHRRQRWEAIGLAGLVDHRAVTRAAPSGRADPQVVAAMRQAIAEAAEESSAGRADRDDRRGDPDSDRRGAANSACRDEQAPLAIAASGAFSG